MGRWSKRGCGFNWVVSHDSEIEGRIEPSVRRTNPLKRDGRGNAERGMAWLEVALLMPFGIIGLFGFLATYVSVNQSKALSWSIGEAVVATTLGGVPTTETNVLGQTVNKRDYSSVWCIRDGAVYPEKSGNCATPMGVDPTYAAQCAEGDKDVRCAAWGAMEVAARSVYSTNLGQAVDGMKFRVKFDDIASPDTSTGTGAASLGKYRSLLISGEISASSALRQRFGKLFGIWNFYPSLSTTRWEVLG